MVGGSTGWWVIRVLSLLLVFLAASVMLYPPVSSSGSAAASPADPPETIIVRSVAWRPGLVGEGVVDLYAYPVPAWSGGDGGGWAGSYRVPYSMVSLLLNPAPVAYGCLGGNVSVEEIAGLYDTVPGAVAWRVYDEASNTTCYGVAAAPGLGFNPFSLRVVRYSLNMLVDRMRLAGAYNGLAVPAATPLPPTHPAGHLARGVGLKYRLLFEGPGRRRVGWDMFYGAMTGAGAVLVNGTWRYRGEPVRVRVLAVNRSGDRELAGLVADTLRALGFEPELRLMGWREAVATVYFGDPGSHGWHVYVEDLRLDPRGPFAERLMTYTCAPGLLVPGMGLYVIGPVNDTLRVIGEEIMERRYSGLATYTRLYRDAVEACIWDSMRIWLLETLAPEPYGPGVSVTGYDAGLGLASPYVLRSLEALGPNASIGVPRILARGEPWNPWRGLYSLYSAPIYYLTSSPAYAPSPYNMTTIGYVVQVERVQRGPIPVPGDAFMWSRGLGRFTEAGPGAADAAVYLDLSTLLGLRYHTGHGVGWGDVLASIAAYHEINDACGEGPLHVVGYRILGGSEELVVYLNWSRGCGAGTGIRGLWEAALAAMRPLGYTVVPAEINVLMLYMVGGGAVDVINKTYVLDPGESVSGEPVLDLLDPVASGDMAAVAGYLLDNYIFNTSYFTVGNEVYMGYPEWRNRLSSLVEWVNGHGHAWISNGPYYLDSADAEAGLLVLRRSGLGQGGWGPAPPPPEPGIRVIDRSYLGLYVDVSGADFFGYASTDILFTHAYYVQRNVTPWLHRFLVGTTSIPFAEYVAEAYNSVYNTWSTLSGYGGYWVSVLVDRVVDGSGDIVLGDAAAVHIEARWPVRVVAALYDGPDWVWGSMPPPSLYPLGVSAAVLVNDTLALVDHPVLSIRVPGGASHPVIYAYTGGSWVPVDSTYNGSHLVAPIMPALPGGPAPLYMLFDEASPPVINVFFLEGSVVPGYEATLMVNVSNPSGYMRDIVLRPVVPRGWSVSEDDALVRLAPYSSKLYAFKVMVPGNASAGVYDIRVDAYELSLIGYRRLGSRHAALVVEEVPGPVPEASPAPAAAASAAAVLLLLVLRGRRGG